MTGGRDKSTVLLTAEEQHAVPKGRARRFGKFARLAGGVAGNMLAHGAAQLATGKRPRAKDLLLAQKCDAPDPTVGGDARCRHEAGADLFHGYRRSATS